VPLEDKKVLVKEMKKIFLSCALAALGIFYAGAASAQTPQGSTPQAGARPARQRVVGDVTTVDASANSVTVHTDAGETVTVSTDDKTAYLRLPPGETSLEKAAHVTFADVRVGDRVLATGVSPSGAQPQIAHQLILMGRADAPAFDPAHRLNGRIASLDAAKKQIVVQTRGRDGVETLMLDASGSVRFLRNAPDSTRASDAQPSSFADLKVGDTVRATGERGSDGKSFRADEIIAGSFTRFFGQIISVDAARGELTVKNEQAGQTVTVAFGPHSTLRRITPEVAKMIADRAAQAQQRRQQSAASGDASSSGQTNAGGAQGVGRGDGEGRRREGGGPEGGRRGGGGFQQMFDNLPAVTVADLKKGDAVNVTGTPGADASHVTAITLVTGDADTLRRMQAGQRGGQGGRGMSPGLPGDVIGNGQGGDRVPPPQK
jgi:hypothetical protein